MPKFLVRPAEQLRVMVASDISRALADGPQSGGAGSRALGAAVIALVAQRDALRRDMLARVAEASRILLYSARTRLHAAAVSRPRRGDGGRPGDRRRRGHRPGPIDLRRARPPPGGACARGRAAAPATRRRAPGSAVRHRHARRAAAARADGTGSSASGAVLRPCSAVFGLPWGRKRGV